jgi:UPF0716 protein FxsA
VVGRLVLLFIVMPVVELAILVQLGMAIGVWPTIGLVVVTGTLGAWLARRQGVQVLRDIQADLSVGRMPAARMLDGLMILVGALLLLTPGIVSDGVGALLLFPWTRAWFKRILRRRLEWMIRSGQVNLMMMVR